MVHNSKILTVSYGTFSCTLEGFDDSFGTMKAIAEYFRDLAADDRYFGAEPPQPDTDMLARIAQREIARQVEARTDDSGTGVILRASDYAAPAAINAPSPATQPAPAPQAEAAPAIETPQTAPELVAPVEAEAPAIAEPAIAEPAPADEIAAERAPEQDSSDSIAAKLQRIRAVVSHNTAPGISEFAEDEHADAFMSDTVRDLSQAIEEDDAAEASRSEETAEDPIVEDELTSVLERYDALSDEEEILADRSPDTVDYDESYDGGDANDDDSDVLSILGAIQSQTEAEQAPSEVAEDATETEAEHEDRIDLSAYKLTPEENAPEDPFELFSDLGSDTTETEDPEQNDIRNILDDDLEVSPSAARETSLSEDDEADLIRELAEVEAETSQTADSADALLSGSDEADEDVSRLMAAAEEKMGTEESSSNRETYNHLRAAVAAAQAERSAGGDVDEETGDDVYREDLANVVRPRRPVAQQGQRPERPTTPDRPAPLKLVAEQRIDLDDDASNRGPVRPRRVAATVEETADTTEASGSGFAKYATEMGATELPDLLEAAASYLAFVEGMDEFSRPQLMRKLRQLEDHEFNREDGLRSFGKLLRQGKIEKAGAGRFSASRNIGFRPDERAVG